MLALLKFWEFIFFVQSINSLYHNLFKDIFNNINIIISSNIYRFFFSNTSQFSTIILKCIPPCYITNITYYSLSFGIIKHINQPALLASILTMANCDPNDVWHYSLSVPRYLLIGRRFFISNNHMATIIWLNFMALACKVRLNLHFLKVLKMITK